MTEEKKTRKPPTPYEGVDIKINKEWIINSDPFNWILINKKGNKIIKTSYHNTLELLCKSYINNATKQADKGGIDELVKSIEKCQDEIVKVINKNIKPLVAEMVKKEMKEIAKEI